MPSSFWLAAIPAIIRVLISTTLSGCDVITATIAGVSAANITIERSAGKLSDGGMVVGRLGMITGATVSGPLGY